jgi:hypothetical protein
MGKPRADRIESNYFERGTVHHNEAGTDGHGEASESTDAADSIVWKAPLLNGLAGAGVVAT